MRQFSLLIIGVLVSAGLGLTLGKMSYAVSSSETLIDAMFEQADLAKNSSNDLNELKNLAKEKTAFQNLYLLMFQNVSEGASDAALEELMTRLQSKKRSAYSKKELAEIVLNGSLVPILERHNLLAEEASNGENLLNDAEAQALANAEYEDFMAANPGIVSVEAFMDWYYAEYVQPDILSSSDANPIPTQEEILREYNELLELYQRELQLQRDYRIAGYEALATEIFYNGDLSDSAGIDLLYDLDLNHMLLFGEPINYPDRSGENAVELSAEEIPLESVVLSEESINPYTCYEDSIQSALDAFYAQDELPSTAPSSEDFVVQYPAFEEEVESGPRAEVAEAFKTLDGFLTQIQGSTGDWSRSLPCSEVFCVTVEFVEESEDPSLAYETTDNCIACHIVYINKRMTETLSYSLVPGKVSMNVFEDATCKDAGKIDFDLNIFTVAMPIQLDPGDDIDEGPAQSIEDLKKTLVAIGAISSPGSSQYEKSLEDLECESIINLQDLSNSSSTLDAALQACREASERIETNTLTAIDESLFEAQHSNVTTLYEQVSVELSQMLLMFRNMQMGMNGQGGFKGTYSIEGAPIPSLSSKQYCL